jgi:hypothetical protein
MQDLRVMKFETLLTPSTYILPKIRSFEWRPQEDITAHELALCLPILICRQSYMHYGAMYDTLPDNAKRHFVVL